jgi:hypothetical protein
MIIEVEAPLKEPTTESYFGDGRSSVGRSEPSAEQPANDSPPALNALDLPRIP